ncbi:MAG TPA: HlyD family efflux transporter periplasmic adaptor subunit [Parafilimonas sp.]|nr:HlyD family efflux transporter periplasmic adaptor subunit [Parafilimonas sp.]
MDKVIEEEVKLKKKRKIFSYVLISVAVLVAAIWMVRFSFASTLKKSSITTAVVERGDIENTINATGEILPEFEEIITSPINASIQNVVMDAGNKIQAGQSILTLDKTAAQTEYDKEKFELESKRNEIAKLKLDLNKSFYDIKSNNDIKQLRINSLEADVENAKRLYKAGGGTKEDVDKAELDLKVANLEKQQLENEIKSKQQTMQLEIREAELAADVEENNLHDLERKLNAANITASRAGVITWINKNIGAAVHEGESIARIADLSSFKVTGSISDNYLDQLHNGMPAIILINETQVRGTVSNIYPSVQNGIVSFDVRLDEQNNKMLRPNMKVDVYLVTDSHSNVLRVANGTAFKGASTQDIFVLQNGKAEKRTVHIGMSNFDYVELKDNVKQGDVIITSDMSDYKNSKEVTIKN